MSERRVLSGRVFGSVDTGSSGGGTGNPSWAGHRNGELFTDIPWTYIVPKAFNGLDIVEVTISCTGLGATTDLMFDVRKEGQGVLDSIFQGDVPIEVAVGATVNTDLYVSGVDTDGTTIGLPGTSFDTGRVAVATGDELYGYLTGVGSAPVFTDFWFQVLFG